MGRDTIQLETAVSTISQEYLLEFTSEYGISEDVHPELPGPEDRIVDFPEDFSGWMKEYFPPPWTGAHMLRRMRCKQRTPTLDMDLFNLISAPNPSKVKTGLRPRAAHEVPLLTATASRVIDMEDPDAVTESSETPSAVEKFPLDFDNKKPASLMTEGKGPEDQAQETVAPEILVTDTKKRTKSKQNRTKPSTKRKAWKSQLSKVNKKSNPTKLKPKKPKSQREIKVND
nr:hypothetical protein [Tanacetum cinerariifolium]